MFDRLSFVSSCWPLWFGSFAVGVTALAVGRWELAPFDRPSDSAPVIRPEKQNSFLDPVTAKPIHWEALHTFNPAAIARNGKVYVLYRAEDDSGEMKIGGHTSRIGLAESVDGIHFRQEPKPVLYPAEDSEKQREWPGGCEDPRIVEAEDGSYVLTYTQWNHVTYDVGIATSNDLRTWVKHGPAFWKAGDGKYQSLQYKSAGIVTTVQGGRLVATKLDGSYWMYWGEGELHLAKSQNLIDWVPLEDAAGHFVSVLSKRAGRFDSSFPEVGPPPVLFDRGVLVLYNGKNADAGGAPSLVPATYAAGEALFSRHDLTQILERTAEPVLAPALPFERSGQYAAGTTFAEGLVLFHGTWFLYYGCADSLVGVALHQGA